VLDIRDGADMHTVQVELPSDLAEALQGDVNEIVLQALEQLLARYRS
jgi:hypothetical protein